MSTLTSSINQFLPSHHIYQLPQLHLGILDQVSLHEIIDRVDNGIHLIFSVFFLLGMCIVFLVSSLVTLYIIKSSLGIDIVSGWSTGLWQLLTL